MRLRLTGRMLPAILAGALGFCASLAAPGCLPEDGNANKGWPPAKQGTPATLQQAKFANVSKATGPTLSPLQAKAAVVPKAGTTLSGTGRKPFDNPDGPFVILSARFAPVSQLGMASGMWGRLCIDVQVNNRVADPRKLVGNMVANLSGVYEGELAQRANYPMAYAKLVEGPGGFVPIDPKGNPVYVYRCVSQYPAWNALPIPKDIVNVNSVTCNLTVLAGDNVGSPLRDIYGNVLGAMGKGQPGRDFTATFSAPGGQLYKSGGTITN